MKEDEQDSTLIQLQEAVDENPDDPSLHLNLGLYLWENGKKLEKAAEHFVISAKLNPQNGNAFRYLGHYYSRVSLDSQRALKCYQRALALNPDDSESGESLCDMLDKEGKESLEISVCREASGKSSRAFWAFRRLGFLQVHHKKWSEAVQSLQYAIRGYPTSADLWEALGLAYQRLGMFTAAIKSYGRAIELEDSRVFALVESGNVYLMLGSFRKGVEQFQRALQTSPQNVTAHYGLASGLLELSKECITSGAFRWGASVLEEASKVAKAGTCLAGNVSCIWKLHGDIQLTYAKCFPWMEDECYVEIDEKAFSTSILSWKRTCYLAAVGANRSYQRALHLAPWQANIYIDVAISLDVVSSLESEKQDPVRLLLPERMILGGLLLESCNDEFWVALGCLSRHIALKQHAFIRSLELDLSLAVAWAYLGKLYRKAGEKILAQHAFDRARSIDPSLALPWAGMSADISIRKLQPEEAYDCCLRAAQILPLAEFQMGLAKLALHSDHLSSPQVFGAIQQALQRAPQDPVCHNLLGLTYEARCDYQSAIASYRLAHCAMCTFAAENKKVNSNDISINLARSFCKAGRAFDAVQVCEDLKRKGHLDSQGLHIYALSSWQLGNNDVALSVVRILAASVKSLEPESAVSSIGFICRLLYYISGQESTIASILKMPKDLFKSSRVTFVVSAIHALDQSNKLDAIVSSSRSSLVTHEEIAAMHFLIALSKILKQGSKDCLGIQDGIDHLRRTLHRYPTNTLIRNLLGYLLLNSKEWKDTHKAARCIILRSSPPECSNKEGLRSASEILGASAVACYDMGNCGNKLSFPTCKYQQSHGPGSLQQLQRSLHQEPWNQNARYLLILNYMQKAREERFPRHICMALERLTGVALSDELYSRKEMPCQYQKFQLLLCASEISMQTGNHVDCVNHAKKASQLLIPNAYLFFSHLLLCRAYALNDLSSLLYKEYIRCLELKTDYHVGWICLKFIESKYKLQSDETTLQLRFEDSSKDIKYSWNMWMAIFKLVQGLIAVWNQDYLHAEELLGQACLLDSAESCFFLCHGAICLKLAEQQCDSELLLHALHSLEKIDYAAVSPLPIFHLLLAQAEGSLGSKLQWERNLQLEWFSWPPERRPSELFLQMYLVSRQLKGSLYSSSSSNLEFHRDHLSWILRAIHLNPSCTRYWKALRNL